MAKKANDLAHTKWMCKYHIVFTRKYRRKIVYNQYKEDLRDIIKQLCSYKGVEIIEGHLIARSYPYAGQYSSQNKCIQLYGVFEREIGVNDVRQTRKFKV